MRVSSRRKFLRVGLGACALVAGGFGLRRSTTGSLVEVRRTGRALGTTISLTVLHADEAAAERAVADALAAVDEVEEVMSLYRPQSRLCELNRAGRLDDAHPWLVDVLQQASELSRATAGAFDVTVQPLWLCWSQAAAAGRLPTDAELAGAQQAVDWRAVDVAPRRIELTKPGMQITLNGIAQGFAADRAAAALAAAGVEHALVDTGEVQGHGSRRDEPWTVGVQHPQVDDAYAAVVRCDGRAISTSGDYATTFTHDRRHHHILDPRCGRSPTELSSVTVAAPTGLAADALSTALFVLGAERGGELLAERPGTDALFLYKDGRRRLTRGFPEEALA